MMVPILSTPQRTLTLRSARAAAWPARGRRRDLGLRADGRAGPSSSIGSRRQPLIQAKLEIGAPDDKYEREADRVADRILRLPGSGGTAVQRMCAECEEEQGLVRAKFRPGAVSTEAGGSIGTEAPPSVFGAIRRPGEPIAPRLRAFFEPRLGQDLGSVRIHRDESAAASARAVGARAFTVGQAVVFGRHQFSTNTPSGLHLLAHELVHTVQQKHAPSASASPAMTLRRQLINCGPGVTGLQSDQEAESALATAHRLAEYVAREALATVERIVSGDTVLARDRDFFDYHFRNPGPGTIRIIRNRYRAILRFLEGHGADYYRCWPATACAGAGSDAQANHIVGDQSRTVICPSFFAEPDIWEQASTLVHEAAHAVGAPDDVYVWEDGYPGTRPFRNAEPYGEFAVDLNHMPRGFVPWNADFVPDPVADTPWQPPGDQGP